MLHVYACMCSCFQPSQAWLGAAAGPSLAPFSLAPVPLLYAPLNGTAARLPARSLGGQGGRARTDFTDAWLGALFRLPCLPPTNTHPCANTTLTFVSRPIGPRMPLFQHILVLIQRRQPPPTLPLFFQPAQQRCTSNVPAGPCPIASPALLSACSAPHCACAACMPLAIHILHLFLPPALM